MTSQNFPTSSGCLVAHKHLVTSQDKSMRMTSQDLQTRRLVVHEHLMTSQDKSMSYDVTGCLDTSPGFPRTSDDVTTNENSEGNSGSTTLMTDLFERDGQLGFDDLDD